MSDGRRGRTYWCLAGARLHRDRRRFRASAAIVWPMSKDQSRHHCLLGSSACDARSPSSDVAAKYSSSVRSSVAGTDVRGFRHPRRRFQRFHPRTVVKSQSGAVQPRAGSSWWSNGSRRRFMVARHASRRDDEPLKPRPWSGRGAPRPVVVTRGRRAWATARMETAVSSSRAKRSSVGISLKISRCTSASIASGCGTRSRTASPPSGPPVPESPCFTSTGRTEEVIVAGLFRRVVSARRVRLAISPSYWGSTPAMSSSSVHGIPRATRNRLSRRRLV